MIEPTGAPRAPQPDPCVATREALPAHALGVLDGAEERTVTAHLAGCARCRAELADLERTMGMLGTAVPPVHPRPEVRAALMQAIADAPRVAPASPAPPRPTAPPAAPPARTRGRRMLWQVGLPAAACLALVTVATLALLLNRAQDERDDARAAQQRITAYLGAGGSLAPLLPEPGAAPSVAGGHGSLAVAPNQDRAMLVVHDLAPSKDGRRYVAWAERDRQRVRLGELAVDDDGTGYLMLYGPEPINSYEYVGIARYEPGATEGEPFLVATVPVDG